MTALLILIGIVIIPEFMDIASNKKKLQIENKVLKIQLERANQTIEIILRELNKKTAANNLYSNFFKKPSVSKDITDAVRYAMKHAHPDNGGNADDFICFQKCYEELTRK